MTVGESEPDIRMTIDTSYIAPTSELSGVYCEDCGENLPRYTDTAV